MHRMTGKMMELYANWMEGSLLLHARSKMPHGSAEKFYLSIGVLPRDARFLMAFSRLMDAYPILMHSNVSYSELSRYAVHIIQVFLLIHFQFYKSSNVLDVSIRALGKILSSVK